MTVRVIGQQCRSLENSCQPSASKYLKALLKNGIILLY